MSFENGMSMVSRLLGQAQALAGLTASLRLQDTNGSGDPLLRQQLDRVVEHLGAQPVLENISPQERDILTAFALSYFRQALELMEDPLRPGEWSYTDPILLQAQGSASAIVASLFVEANIGRPDARILDIGTGVAALAIAFCKAYPRATVVGLDPWEPALTLAEKNISAAGMEKRITLRRDYIQSYDDPEGFDLVWLPAFFIPERILDEAIRNIYRIARPEATIVVGCNYDESEDPLLAAVDDLLTVRSGGTPLTPDDAMARLTRAGFSKVQQVTRTWKAPLQLVVGKRVGGSS
jgi:SAM-dependent methyltransferase